MSTLGMSRRAIVAGIASAAAGEQAAALGEVTITTKTEMQGDGGDAEPIEVKTTKIKLVDKLRALEMIGKHFKMFADRIEHDVAGNLAERLDEAIRRARAAKE